MFFSSDHLKLFMGFDASHPPPCCGVQHKDMQECLEGTKASCSRSGGLWKTERTHPGAFSPTLPGEWLSLIPGSCSKHGLTAHGGQIGSMPSHPEPALSPLSCLVYQHRRSLRVCVLELNFYKVPFSFICDLVTILCFCAKITMKSSSKASFRQKKPAEVCFAFDATYFQKNLWNYL